MPTCSHPPAQPNTVSSTLQKAMTPFTEKRQSVWIVRYGLTKFPLVEHLGPFNSPLDETEGLNHANAIAERLRQEVVDSGSVNKGVVHVYSSPFTRTTETANIIASALPDEASRVRVEEGLTEWQQKSLLVDPTGTITFPNTVEDLSARFAKIDTSYQSVNRQSCCHASSVSGRDFMEESEQVLFERCSKTVDGILNECCQGNSFIIVSHAPCDQSMAVFFEGKSLCDSSLGPWPLGGITKFSRAAQEDGSFGSWHMDFYGDTRHMPGEYKGGLKAWSLPTLAKEPSATR